MIYTDAFGTYFKWGATVRHITSGVTGRVVSFAAQGSMFVLTAESDTLVGSPRVPDCRVRASMLRRESMTHTCHHPTCTVPVPPKMLACRTHWYQLPLELRNAVWRTYKLGQEVTKTPSKEYMEVIAQVQQYWRDMLNPIEMQ